RGHPRVWPSFLLIWHQDSSALVLQGSFIALSTTPQRLCNPSAQRLRSDHLSMLTHPEDPAVDLAATSNPHGHENPCRILLIAMGSVPAVRQSIACPRSGQLNLDGLDRCRRIGVNS